MKDSTIQDIDTRLGGRKATVIIERMFDGISTLPTDPFVLATNASAWYERLADSGLLLAQIPPGFSPFLQQWKTHAETVAPALDIRTDNFMGRDIIRIHKRPGSPATLPLLSAKITMEQVHPWRSGRSSSGQ